MYCYLSRAPYWGPDLSCNPGMCPDWESNQRPLGLQAGTQSTEPHQPGQEKIFLNHLSSKKFVFLEWSRVSSLYILEIRPLSEVSLANTFSHIDGSLFILMLFSLAMQKLFILMRSHLFIPSFMSLALGDVSMRILLHGMSEIFLPMFSSRTFMVLQLIFKSFILLEFIFVYGVSWWPLTGT